MSLGVGDIVELEIDCGKFNCGRVTFDYGGGFEERGVDDAKGADAGVEVE